MSKTLHAVRSACHGYVLMFDHIKTAQDDVKIYTVHTQLGPMNLQVRRAGEKNKKYFNALLQKNKHLQNRRHVKIDVAAFEQNRNNDYDLFPKFVVVGWDSTVVDSSGKPAVFNEENCRAFLKALGDDKFDDLRNFCQDYTNFDREDVTETVGNS